MPSTFISLFLELLCGRAKAIINNVNAVVSRTNTMCLKYDFHDFGSLLKNPVSEKRTYACCLLQLNMYHTINIGMIIKPRRKYGDANSIELILLPPFLRFVVNHYQYCVSSL